MSDEEGFLNYHLIEKLHLPAPTVREINKDNGQRRKLDRIK